MRYEQARKKIGVYFIYINTKIIECIAMYWRIVTNHLYVILIRM